MEIDKLNYLAAGVSKAPLPIYASCLHSNGTHLITCNDDILIKVEDDDIPFIGSVNFLVLYNILRNVSRDYNIKSENSKLIISDNNSISELPIMTMHYPIIELDEDIELFEVTEEIYNIIKAALFFKGKDVYSNVIISGDKIISTDTSRLFVHTLDNSFPIKLGINSSIFSILKIGNRVGLDEHGNVIIKFEGGFGMFTTELVDDFPDEKILKFVNTLDVNREPITEVSNVQKACNKVSPILLNETNDIVLSTVGNKLVMKAESIVNGKREVVISDTMEENINLSIDYSVFKNVPNDFTMNIDDDKIILNKDNTLIILMGQRKED